MPDMTDPQMQLLMAQQLRQPQGAQAYPYDMQAHSAYTSPDQPLQHEYSPPGSDMATAFPAPEQNARPEIQLPTSYIDTRQALPGGGHVDYRPGSQPDRVPQPMPTPASAQMQDLGTYGGDTQMQNLGEHTVRPRSALGRTLHQMFKGGLLGWKER